MAASPSTKRLSLAEQVSLPSNPSYQAYRLLQFAFTVLPLVVGIDKFFHYLVDWELYLSPVVPGILHIAPRTLMRAAGFTEIFIAVGVAWKPKVFAYLICGWLLSVATNLLLTGGAHLDVAARDFGLFLAAMALARLSHQFG